MVELPDYISDITKELFAEAYNGLSVRLQKYSESVRNALLLTDMNLSDKALVVPAIHHGFVDCLFSERRKLKTLEDYRDEKIEDHVEKYGKSGAKRYETRVMAEQSEVIKKMDKAIESQKEVIRYLEEVCRILSNFNFSVKNCVDMMKMM